MSRTQAHRWILLSTPLGDDVLLLSSFTGSEQLSRPFQLELTLLSERSDIRFEDLIGKNVTIRMDVGGEEPRYFNGFVTRFAQTETGSGLSSYRAAVAPWLWFLTRHSDCRIFQDMTVPEIVKQVFRDRGFSDFKDSLTATYPKWEFSVQYRETDFNFVNRLLEQEGIYYFFTHENGKHTLVLADAPGAHKPFAGFETYIYRPPSEGAEELDRVRHWSVEKEVLPAGYTLADFDFKNPRTQLVSRSAFQRDHAMADGEIFDYPGEYNLFGEGETYARVRIEEWQAQYEVASGAGDVRGVAAGSTFSFADHPREDQNREYLIVSASYQAQSTGFDSGGSGLGADAPAPGGSFSCNITAVPASTQFRPARTTPKPTIQGPQTAIVVGKKGEEIWTDEHGRIKVKFHWDRDPEANEKSSCWVRVAQVWAGKKWGGIFMPRIGQEVIVEFLEGDPDQPIITGRVYNGDNKTPYPLPAHATVSTIKSSMSKGGGGFNEFRFEDKKGEEQVFTHAEKNLHTRVKNDCREWIGNDRHLIVKHDQLEHVENDRSETVDRDHKEKIGRDRNLKVVGKEAKEVGCSLSLTVKDDVIEVFKKNHSEETTKDNYIKADNICIEGMTNITIKVGQTSIALESDGITIETLGEIKVKSLKDTSFKSDTGNFKAEATLNAEIKGTVGAKLEGAATATIKGGMVMIN